MRDCGIVTAISPNMWNDYLVFYDSIRRFHDWPIYLICLEMLPWHLEALKKHMNVHSIIMDEGQVEDYKKTDPHWRQWYKPFYLDMVPKHDTMLWLDLDVVVLDSLDPLFTHIERQFLVIADYFAPKTCLNKYELYKKYKLEVPKEKSQIALNSGVFGYKPGRDKEILKLWRRKVNIAAEHADVRSWITLFDQGALLWALQELDLYHLILAKKPWNYPAKKNPYELKSKSVADIATVQTPIDTIDSIRIDNPDAVIAHFAGLPKLAHLCEPNHPHSQGYCRRKNGTKETRRLFVTGPERSGLRVVAEIFRRSVGLESWVRYGLKPTLAAEAQAQHLGYDYHTTDFLERLNLYARRDCGFVCEANKNLAFFTNEIYHKSNGTARFVVLLRDPVRLIRSRFLNFITWPSHLWTTPDFYRADYRKFIKLGSDTTNNYFRCTPPGKLDLLDLHIWEVEHILNRLVHDLNEIPPHSYKFVWLENLKAEIFHLARFAGVPKVESTQVEKIAKQRFITALDIHSSDTAQWVDDLLHDRMVEIYKRMGAVLQHLNVQIPYRGV